MDGRIRYETVDGHCWVVTRHLEENGPLLPEWDIAHHMKAGLAPICPALNPRPGCRLALSHSLDHVFGIAGRSAEMKVMGLATGLADGRQADVEFETIKYAQM